MGTLLDRLSRQLTLCAISLLMTVRKHPCVRASVRVCTRACVHARARECACISVPTLKGGVSAFPSDIRNCVDTLLLGVALRRTLPFTFRQRNAI